MRDVRIIALDQLGQSRTFSIWWIATLDGGARRMLFRRIQLGKARPLNTRLPIVTARGDLLLLHSKLQYPYLRAVVIGCVTNHHNLKDRFIGREIEFVVELRDQRAKFFEESDVDGLQIRLALAGRGLVTGVGPADTLKIAVHSNGLRVGGNAPFRSPE